MSNAARLVLDTLVLLAVGLTALVLGWSVAPSLVAWTCERAGIETLAATAPSDFAYAYGTVGAALALPALVGWGAVVVHFALARRAAPPWLPAAVVGLDLACVGLGIAWQVWAVVRSMEELSGVPGLEPMITIGGLGLGGAGLRLGLVGGLALWGASAWLARRTRSAGAT